jgi:hypothetical protein
MSAEHIVARLRTFLLTVTVIVCGGTVIELLLLEHTGEPVQLIPFVLSIIGASLALLVLLKPTRQTIHTLRIGMMVVFLGSGLGMVLHLVSNFEFELEMRPGSTIGDVFSKALMGANPLLSPGVLALAAVLAIAATYYHPAKQST